MFSVIIPVYNGAKFIENAIESVFQQSYTSWEMIIIDDGSQDETAEILKKYRHYEKIHILSQENQGVSAARNHGVQASKGKYIAFLDADDLWHPNHLDVMNSLIQKYPNAGLYATFTRTELVNGEVIDQCPYFNGREDIYTEDFFEEYCRDKSAKMFTVITTCLTRDAFDKAGGFPVGCKIGEDLELSLMAAAYYPVALSSKATATYKKENSTATKSRSFDPDWGFFERVKTLYSDDSIAKQKRENLKKLMEWFSMRRTRHYILEGNRKKAVQVFRSMDKRAVSKKDVAINALLLMLPGCVVNKIFEVRWRGKA